MSFLDDVLAHYKVDSVDLLIEQYTEEALEAFIQGAKTLDEAMAILTPKMALLMTLRDYEEDGEWE